MQSISGQTYTSLYCSLIRLLISVDRLWSFEMLETNPNTLAGLGLWRLLSLMNLRPLNCVDTGNPQDTLNYTHLQ